MTQITRLGLNKLFLWSEAERFQTFPQALTKLEPGCTYTRQQIGEKLFGLVYSDDGKARRKNLLTNLFGCLQIAPDKVLLRGINLFRRLTPNGSQNVSGMIVWERTDDVWIPNQAALQMAQAYGSAPQAIRWQQLLAEQLGRYEPRTRTLLYLLSHNHRLCFEQGGYFSGNSRNAQLIGKGSYRLFDDRGAAFNRLLMENLNIAIGPWWRGEIEEAGFELAEDFELQGARNRPPSTNTINSALKTALYVFYTLGILVREEEDWYVDTQAFAQHLSPELCADLLGKTYTAPPDLSDDWKRLAYAIAELADERGFVVATEIADRWGALAGVRASERAMAFDALVRRGIFESRIEVLERHPGQPRMGRGLLDDDNMRLVRLRVLTQ